MVLTVSSVISPVTGFVVTVVKRKIPRNLTPASGRQDHTTSPSALAPFVSSTISVHRIPSRACDDRETPLCETGQHAYKFDLGQARMEIFLEMGLDSRAGEQPVGQISRPLHVR
jgi:hypothetical protein